MPDPHPVSTADPTTSPAGPVPPPPSTALMERLRTRVLDAAAERVLADVLADAGGSLSGDRGRFRRGRAVVGASSVVLATVAAVAVLLAWWTLQPKGALAWVGVGLAWAVVVALVPWPGRDTSDPADPGDVSGGAGGSASVALAADGPTARLVADVAATIGSPPPAALRASAGFETFVRPTGWRGRSELVVGVPLWTSLRDDERVALLAHETAHVGAGDVARGRVVGLAVGVLRRLRAILTPPPSFSYSALGEPEPETRWSDTIVNRVGGGLLSVVAAPAELLLLGLERLGAADSQRAEYRADRAAAEVAGTDAVVRLLVKTTRVSGLHTLAGSAARRREDPFAALDAVRDEAGPTAAQVEGAVEQARLGGHRWDDTHPRDDLRIRALLAHPHGGGLTPLLAAEAASADDRVLVVRRELTRPFSHDLLETWY